MHFNNNFFYIQGCSYEQLRNHVHHSWRVRPGIDPDRYLMFQWMTQNMDAPPPHPTQGRLEGPEAGPGRHAGPLARAPLTRGGTFGCQCSAAVRPRRYTSRRAGAARREGAIPKVRPGSDPRPRLARRISQFRP